MSFSVAGAPEHPTFARMLGDVLAKLQQGGPTELLRQTVALLCQERDQGSVCVSLQQWQGKALVGGLPFPPVDEWQTALLTTGLCGDGAPDAAPRPLVLRPDGRLYLLRHYRIEVLLLAFLKARLAAPALTTPGELRRTLDALQLLPARPDGEPDWQLAAIVTAAHRPFAVLCGGPGTGKTTTVARLLAVLRHGNPALRIALAAPTGKAAARLGEALRERSDALAGCTSCDVAAPSPMTLHRLLGYLALDDTFRAGADRLLPYDVVIVDEASMVDPAILAVLFSALRPDARLLLVGDKDQLAAIAAGQVLGELCRSAAPTLGAGPALAAFMHAATGMQLPVQENANPMADATIALVHNHRFGRQPGIGSFAAALAARDPKAALVALAAGHSDLRHAGDADTALASLADALFAAAAAADPAEALRRLHAVRILCATRHGRHGAEAWNQRVEAMLRQRGRRIDGAMYAGRPILVLANDHQNKIWNGDLGVLHFGSDGRLCAWFATTDGPPRAIAPARLPPYETAWAMTVHKAQGSEFDCVVVSMPDRAGPLWQASLIYTALTRARQRAILLADPTLLAPALETWPDRSSGLARGLQAR